MASKLLPLKIPFRQWKAIAREIITTVMRHHNGERKEVRSATFRHLRHGYYAPPIPRIER